MIRVYHNPYFYRFQQENISPELHTLYLAAAVHTHRPHEAYHWTNEEAAESHEHVCWITTNRRTRLGDVLELVDDSGQLLLIDQYGFKEMPARLPWQKTPIIQELLAQLHTEILSVPGDEHSLPVTAVTEIRQLRHILVVVAGHIQSLHHALTLAMPIVDEARASVNFSVESWTMRERRRLSGVVLQQSQYALDQLNESSCTIRNDQSIR